MNYLRQPWARCSSKIDFTDEFRVLLRSGIPLCKRIDRLTIALSGFAVPAGAGVEGIGPGRTEGPAADGSGRTLLDCVGVGLDTRAGETALGRGTAGVFFFTGSNPAAIILALFSALIAFPASALGSTNLPIQSSVSGYEKGPIDNVTRAIHSVS